MNMLFALCNMILLSILAGIFFGEKESIIKKRYVDHDVKLWSDKSWFPKFLRLWWESNNWFYKYWIVQQLMRYPLAIFKDGYHYCGGLSVILCAFAVVAGAGAEFHPGIVALVVYTAHGIGVNISHHDWIKNL